MRNQAYLRVALIAFGVAVCCAAVSTAFSSEYRSPEIPIARMNDRQQLTLAINLVSQQLAYGPIHGDFLSALRKPETGHTSRSSRVDGAQAFGVGYDDLRDRSFVGLGNMNASIEGDLATVAVDFILRRSDDLTGEGPLFYHPDTVEFMRRQYPILS